MKKNHNYFFALLVIIFSCESPSEPLYNNQDFFPLKIGNKWYYNTGVGGDNTSFDEIWEISAMRSINSKDYFEMISSKIGLNYEDTVYYRFGADTLFSLRLNSFEWIMADFSLKLNEYAYWDSEGDLKVTERTDSIITFSKPFGADYGSSITFKRNVGIITSIQNGFILYSKYLVKAELK